MKKEKRRCQRCEKDFDADELVWHQRRNHHYRVCRSCDEEMTKLRNTLKGVIDL